MRAFECALRIMRGNVVFLLVYIVGLSFMGLFMAQSLSFPGTDEVLDEKSAAFSVVDRDGSALAKGLETFLEDRGVPVAVEDSRQAFQDAVAKGQTDYLLVVPEGYGEAFREAALAGEEEPQMDVVYSYYAADGALMDQAVAAYLSCVRTLVLAHPDRTLEEVAQAAAQAMDQRVDVQMIGTDAGMSEADRFVFFLQWSTYTLFAGIVVSIGLLISTVNRADVRRRNLASPLSYASYNVQLALACAVIAAAAVVWTFALGLMAFPDAVHAISPGGLALCALTLAVYAFMALAFGFMLGQFGISALMCNAFGNIFGMLISFLGGAWVAIDLLSPGVQALSRWLPGFWYTDACQKAAHLSGGAGLQDVLMDVGVLVLFAAAFLAVGFAAAKRRLQTSEAGGNRAAEAVMVV